MQQQPPLYLFFVMSLLVLALTQLLSVTFFLYWVYPWLDIPMHALGGVTVALGFLAFFPRYVDISVRTGFLATLGAVAIIGVGWEAYEYATGTVFGGGAPVADTVLDVVMDLAGGTLGYVMARTTRDA